MTNLEWIKNNCVALIEELIVAHLDKWLSENKNIPFESKDILQNDIGKHIILEWIKQDDEFLKTILSENLGLKQGFPYECTKLDCEQCDFIKHCNETTTREWLETEHESLYKKGDVVLDTIGDLWIIKKIENNYAEVCLSTRFCQETCSIESTASIPETLIVRKVGSIYE